MKIIVPIVAAVVLVAAVSSNREKEEKREPCVRCVATIHGEDVECFFCYRKLVD